MPNTENAATTVTAFPNTHIDNSAQTAQKQLELFPEIEPWSEPVNGDELVNEIKTMLNKYLYLPDGADVAISTWVMHTYGIECFDFTPRLYISSPMPGCGKSTLMDLVGLLSYRPLKLSGITAAAMFRIVAEYKPTLLIDEADTFLKGNEELRGIINAGYEQSGKVSRVETINKKQAVSIFPCYGACAIAGIGGTHKTIQERSVNIIMKRKTHADKIERMRRCEIRNKTTDVQRKCVRWMQDHACEINHMRPNMPTYMSDRATDIWEPLFAIAETISPQWLDQINYAAKMLNKTQPNDDDSSMRFQLLADIKTLFDGRPLEAFYSSGRLAELLNQMEESPWSEFGYGRGLNPHSLAKQLRFFSIVPRQSRNDGNRNRGYYHSDFLDAFSRYLSENVSAQTEPEQPTSARHTCSLDSPMGAVSEKTCQNEPEPNNGIDFDEIPDIPY